MPGATWRPVPNCTKNGQESVNGVILHIMEGTLDGSDSWFRNASAQASAHFGVGKDGRIYQWVDTADRAWAQGSGNRTWLSIEHEGHSGQALTDQQLAATARVIAWMYSVHKFPLQQTDNVTRPGIGWHGMGGSAWGGHSACPGEAIKNQRPAILRIAASITTQKPTTPDTTSTNLVPFPGSNFFATGRRSPIIASMRTRLITEGCDHYTSTANTDTWGSGDLASYAAWQRKLGYSGKDADGIPGPTTWTQLRVPQL
ncbi:peptidoglycan-binding protein [Streptomyces sp. NPDC002537]